MDIEKNIQETTYEPFTEASWDKASRILRGVHVMSGNISKNLRTYSTKAQESIVRLLEGCACYIDHPEGKTSGGIRSVRPGRKVF